MTILICFCVDGEKTKNPVNICFLFLFSYDLLNTFAATPTGSYLGPVLGPALEVMLTSRASTGSNWVRPLVPIAHPDKSNMNPCTLTFANRHFLLCGQFVFRIIHIEKWRTQIFKHKKNRSFETNSISFISGGHWSMHYSSGNGIRRIQSSQKYKT